MLKYFYLDDKAIAMSIEISVGKDPIIILSKLKLCNELLFAALNLNIISINFRYILFHF